MANLGISQKAQKEEEKEMEEQQGNIDNEQNQQNDHEEIAQSENTQVKTYLKAMPLRDLGDLEKIKNEVRNGNILILKITPLASKNILEVSQAVNELYSFTEEIRGDIARLGDERIVICPPHIKIWREKKPAQKEQFPTAA